MGKLTLVLGGTKSGKTGYAESLAYGDVLYLATAEVLDDEMKLRVNHHKRSRPKDWDTVEETRDILNVLQQNGDKYDFILMDCLTLWMTNMLGELPVEYNREELLSNNIKSALEFVEEIKNRKADLVIVSNQVEVGLVSPYPLGRVFQDLAGLMHQKIAQYADSVVVMQAGLPLRLKG